MTEKSEEKILAGSTKKWQKNNAAGCCSGKCLSPKKIWVIPGNFQMQMENLANLGQILFRQFSSIPFFWSLPPPPRVGWPALGSFTVSWAGPGHEREGESIKFQMQTFFAEPKRPQWGSCKSANMVRGSNFPGRRTHRVEVTFGSQTSKPNAVKQTLSDLIFTPPEVFTPVRLSHSRPEPGDCNLDQPWLICHVGKLPPTAALHCLHLESNY